MSDTEVLVAIVGLAAVTLITRAFFLLPGRDLPLPAWLREGLRYAPLAALVAVVVPEVLLSQGALLASWRDPRPWAAAAGLAWFFRRRSILGTIVCGTAVMLALRLGWGW